MARPRQVVFVGPVHYLVTLEGERFGFTYIVNGERDTQTFESAEMAKQARLMFLKEHQGHSIQSASLLHAIWRALEQATKSATETDSLDNQ